MRLTRKYVQASITAHTTLGVVVRQDIAHNDLYQMLEAAGYSWSANKEAWEYRPAAQHDDSAGSTIHRARLMAYPNQIDSFVEDAQRAFASLGYTIDEVSSHYPNRRGAPGTRVYLTMTKEGSR